MDRWRLWAQGNEHVQQREPRIDDVDLLQRSKAGLQRANGPENGEKSDNKRFCIPLLALEWYQAEIDG